MSIKQQITTAQTDLMKQRVSLKQKHYDPNNSKSFESQTDYVVVREQLNTAMGILADIKNLEKELKVDNLSDADQIAIVKKTKRQLEEDRDLRQQNGRDVTIANHKIAFANQFLPQLKDESETRSKIESLISEGANMGKIMQTLRASGDYDLKLAQSIAKELL